MGNKLYVGNLPFSVNDDSLMDLFSKYGSVSSAKVIMDRDTNRSKGFGFVEMSSGDEAQKAIDALNGSEVEGRQITVNEARPQERRNGGGHGGHGGGGHGGHGGGHGGGRDRGDRGGRGRY
ncbi:MAG: RNA-binding protein [Oligoflexia bacterium]|nr:RNA-binding protein [Oligoflexia bacterium]